MAEQVFPKDIDLSYPIEVGKEIISTITIKRRPVAGDLAGFKSDMPEYDKTLRLVGKVTGYPPPVINELGFDDLSAILEVIKPFLPKQES